MIGDYYTLPEAADTLGLERKTLWARLNRGLVKADKIGHNWLIHSSEVDRLKTIPPGRPNKRRGQKSFRKKFIELHREAYNSWLGMISRCKNPNNPSWVLHGGKGVRVCKRWLIFENFLEDMGDRPPGMTLDRKNNNGHYEPRNCRWASSQEQNSNRSPWETL
jgi:hypothetical protein